MKRSRISTGHRSHAYALAMLPTPSPSIDGHAASAANPPLSPPANVSNC